MGARGQEIRDNEEKMKGIQNEIKELSIKLEQKENEYNLQEAELKEVKNHKYGILIKAWVKFLV